jgi:tetratricopeptide (TPR) repeat protein
MKIKTVVVTCFAILFPFLSETGLSDAAAQDGAQSEADRRYRQAFEAMTQDLSNPERAFEFVQAATEVGDIRGAIAALERILLINPGLPNIKAELGLLYLRTGAIETAERYLNEALESGEVPIAYRERITTALQRATELQARNRISGSLFAGGRFESNPDAAPTRAQFVLEGVGLIVEDRDIDRDSDFGVSAVADLTHVYDFGGQRGDNLETNLLLYNDEFFEVDEADFNFAELSIGPAFFLGNYQNPLKVRPFAVGSLMWLENTYYRSAFGVGLELATALADRTDGRLSFRGERQAYRESEENPDANLYTGQYYALNATVDHRLSPNLILSGTLLGAKKNAAQAFEDYQEIGAAIGATYFFADPFGQPDLPWSVSATAQYRNFDFDVPDPTINPNEKRDDDRWDVRLSAGVPVIDRLNAVISTSYTRNNSTIPNREYDNFTVGIGVSYRFSTAF